MRFQWIGGPTFVLEFGCCRALCDPVLGEGEAAFTLPRHPSSGEADAAIGRTTPLPALDPAGIECVLVTTNRADHIDAAAADRIDKSKPVFAPSRGVDHVLGLGFDNVNTLDWWQEYTLTEGDESVTLTAVPTHPGGGEESGASNGYLITRTIDSNSTVAYTTGETRWFSGARAIRERAGKLDLFVPLLGAVGADGPGGAITLDGKDAMQFVFMFTPKRVIPVGFNTFSHYTQSIDDFEERVALTMYERRLVRLQEGETYEP